MKRLELLDYGRFFAAIVVVFFHYTFSGIYNGKVASIEHTPALIAFTKYGYLGVQFFFMISGYVIFFSAKNRTASQFATSRALRLYPAFWAALLFTGAFALFWGGPLMSVSLEQIAANLTMVPREIGFEYVDGVYWTLFWELKFYLLTLLLILIGAQRHLEYIFLAWPLLMAIALRMGLTHLPYMGGYYCFFAAGAVFAIARNKLSLKVAVPLLTAYLLCVYSVMGQAANIAAEQGIERSGIVVSVAMTAFFAFFFILNSTWGSSLSLPKSGLLGALTYPVYLIHAHFGFMMLTRYATEENKWIVYLALVVIVMAVSYAIHTVVEVKYEKQWKYLFRVTVGRVTGLLQQPSHYLFGEQAVKERSKDA